MNKRRLYLLPLILVFLVGCKTGSLRSGTTSSSQDLSNSASAPEVTVSLEANNTAVPARAFSAGGHECDGYGWEFKPVWSPTGEYIAYVSVFDGDSEIYLLDVTEILEKGEPGVPVKLTDNDAFDHDVSWSPDGEKIAFTSDRDGDGDIYIMDIKNDTTIQITNDPTYEIRPKWSPDGEQIVYSLAPIAPYDG